MVQEGEGSSDEEKDDQKQDDWEVGRGMRASAVTLMKRDHETGVFQLYLIFLVFVSNQDWENLNNS